MLWERSPFATAPMTRATSAVGCTRSDTSPFAESTQAAQAPRALGSAARCDVCPCLPTLSLSRPSSRESPPFSSMISFSTSATLPASPVRATGMRTPKSPFRTAMRVSSSTASSG